MEDEFRGNLTFSNVMENGCQVEDLKLRTLARVERTVALFMVVAWRIARLMRLGRICLDLEASLLFDQDE